MLKIKLAAKMTRMGGGKRIFSGHCPQKDRFIYWRPLTGTCWRGSGGGNVCREDYIKQDYLYTIVLLIIVQTWRNRRVQNNDEHRYHLNLPCSYFRARINCLRHSNTVFPLVRLIMWLLRTNKSTILLFRRKYIRALKPLHRRF